MQTSQNNFLSEALAASETASAHIVSEDRKVTLDNLHGSACAKDALPQNVAICFADNIDLIQALVCLDGAVQKLLILSPTMDVTTVEGLIEAGDIQALYTDSPDLSHLDIVSSFEAAKTSEISKFETRWLLATSGTTSSPKLVSHSFASLTRTISDNSKGKDFVWGQLYDSARFAGLQVVLQAVLGGSKFVAPSTDLALYKKLSLFAKEGVNALSATPTLWRKILMLEGSHDLNLRSITLGGEIADQAILNALSARYPNAKIRHIYASTEAGAGFSVSDGKAGFPASYLTQTGNGIAISIKDDVLYIQLSLIHI